MTLVLLGATVLSTTLGLFAVRARHDLQDALEEKNQALSEALRLRAEADDAREGVEQRNAELERVAYGVEIRNIQQKLADSLGTSRQVRRLELLAPEHRGYEWTWLRERMGVQPMVRQQLDPSGHVQAVEFSRDGTRVLACTDTGVARIYLAAGGEPLVQLQSSGYRLNDGHFDPTGSRVLLASAVGHLALYDAFTGEEIAREPIDAVSTCYSPDGSTIAAIDSHGIISIVAADDLRTLERIETGVRPVNRMDWHAGREQFALAGEDGHAYLVDGNSGSVVRSFQHRAGGGRVRTARFNADGSQLVTTGEGGRVLLWETDSGRFVRSFRPHQQRSSTSWGSRDAKLSPSGSLLASCGRDRLLRVHNMHRGQAKGAFHVDGTCHVVDFDPSGTRIASGDSSGSLCIWDLGDLGMSVELLGHRAGVMEICVSPDGAYVYSASDDGTLRKWELKTGRQVYAVQTHPMRLYSVDLDASGSVVVVGADDGTGRVIDAATGEVLRPFEVPTGSVRDYVRRTEAGGAEWFTFLGLSRVRVNAGLGLIAAGVGTWSTSRDPERPVPIHLFDLDTGHLRRSLDGHQSTVIGLDFSPDGSVLASIGYDGRLILWDTTTWERRATLFERTEDHPGASGRNVLIDGTHRLVLSAWIGGVVRAHDLDTGELEWNFRAHSAPVTDLSLSPDGSRLLTTPFLGTEGAKLFDIESQSELLSLASFLPEKFSARFAGPNRVVIAAGRGYGTIRCFEAVPDRDRYAERRAVLEERRAARAIELAASALVDQRKEQLVLVDDIVESIRADTSIDEPVREAALEITRVMRDDPWDLNMAAYEIAELPGRTAEAYARAVRWALLSLEGTPQDRWEYPSVLNTVGVALYRVDRFEDAIEYLLESERTGPLDARVGESGPENTAVLALCHHQLGHHDQARIWLDRTRAHMKSDLPGFSIASSTNLLKEAEQLIEGEPPGQ
ncbi:MAG: outer membrane protein assembly factor BamB family protein [Planctomycetota bacterium]